jgi:hypothetical protein
MATGEMAKYLKTVVAPQVLIFALPSVIIIVYSSQLDAN